MDLLQKYIYKHDDSEICILKYFMVHDNNHFMWWCDWICNFALIVIFNLKVTSSELSMPHPCDTNFPQTLIPEIVC